MYRRSQAWKMTGSICRHPDRRRQLPLFLRLDQGLTETVCGRPRLCRLLSLVLFELNGKSPRGNSESSDPKVKMLPQTRIAVRPSGFSLRLQVPDTMTHKAVQTGHPG
jgi:hypothetical protein